MSEWSRNSNTEGMRRKDRLRIGGVRLAIQGIQSQAPRPLESPEFIIDSPTRIPGAIGSVLLPHEIDHQPEETA